MAFYDLSKEKRAALVADIQVRLRTDLKDGNHQTALEIFSDEDTYIRKTGYLSIGRIYKAEEAFRGKVIQQLKHLSVHENEKVRQTVINAAGEIGMMNFEIVQAFFDAGLFDEHHSVRNAVIGSLKKMSQKNPKPTLKWAKKYLKHPEKEVRREICHGIELRGRTHPQDILPLLQSLQHDETARVRNTLVHVLGQISYKKGCLPTVVSALKQWENKALVQDALDEIIDVHSEKRYAKFTALTQEQVITYIGEHFQ